MKILFFCPWWGSQNLPVEIFMEKVKQSGYDGVEISLPLNDHSLRGQILKGIESQGLEFIAQHYEAANPDPDTQLAEYRKYLGNLVAAKPLFVNSQTGKDWFSFEQNKKLIDAAREISEKSGVKILHETHRGKFSFCAQATARYLEADPGLRLAADFSHWCVVSESLLDDQDDAVSLAIERTDHIHARIGHAEGPQVSDPRAPEWKPALEAHLAWWDRVIAKHEEKKTPRLTITPEFGPLPYMPALPFTRQPVASQWEINTYMMDLLRQRYL